MSRIGNAPINIPEKVEINVSEDNLVTIKGPEGELIQRVDPSISLKVEENELLLSRASETLKDKSLHGMYRAILSNAVEGVANLYTKKLELIGVGYRAKHSGNLLELTLGYSHPIHFAIPEEVSIDIESDKGKKPTIILKCADKQLLGQVAAKVRSFRKPEPYKGKGVRYVDEYVRRKVGKAVAK